MYLRQLMREDEQIEKNPNKKQLMYIGESYKNVRASLMFALAGKEEGRANIIIITSAEQGDGKTTTCINTASAFADSNAKVLIIDADLRRPKISKYLGQKKEGQKGLSDVLGGFCSIDEAIAKNPDGNDFDCLYAGTVPPNPSELLMLEKVQDVIEELATKYDYIFIDTPPVGVVSETLYLTRFATGVVLVVKKGFTHFKKLTNAVDSLKFANANILGTVLTNSVNARIKYYYYRSKRYYYY